MRHYYPQETQSKVALKGSYSGDLSEVMAKYMWQFKQCGPIVPSGKAITSRGIESVIGLISDMERAIINYGDCVVYYAKDPMSLRNASLLISSIPGEEAIIAVFSVPKAMHGFLDIMVSDFLDKTGIHEVDCPASDITSML